MSSTIGDIEDFAAFGVYLVQQGVLASHRVPFFEKLEGGVSNRTVLVDCRDGRELVFKQALEKLRVEVDWFSSPERVHREAAGLRDLSSLLPVGAVPELVFEDVASHVIGMSAVSRPHENWKALLLAGEVDLGLIDEFANILATVQRESSRRLERYREPFDDRSFFESLRLEPYYAFAAEQVPVCARFLEDLIAETRSHREALVHGDFSPKNVLVADGRLVLLDHEVLHIGDPAFDVGFALTHLLSKAQHVRHARDEFLMAARRFFATYRTGVAGASFEADLEGRCVRQALGSLLARVAGRSPLEYLDDSERSCQRRVVTGLTEELPTTIDELVDRFEGGLEKVRESES